MDVGISFSLTCRDGAPNNILSGSDFSADNLLGADRMGHAYSRLHYHLVFSTKEQKTFIKPDLKPRLHAYMAGIIRNLDGVVEEIGDVEDHVHLLFFSPPKHKLSDVISKIKSNSSGWVHDTWPERGGFAWQGGYGIFSVSESNVEGLKAYIQDQEIHHQRMTFQEEFLALLQKHTYGIDQAAERRHKASPATFAESCVAAPRLSIHLYSMTQGSRPGHCTAAPRL